MTLKKEFIKHQLEKGVSIKENELSLNSIGIYIKWLESQLIAARKESEQKPPAIFGSSSLVLSALEIYGLTEIKGSLSDPLILEMFRSAGHSWVKDDATAWCSAFMCWLCNRNGYESTQKLNARSWLDLSDEVSVENLKVGDILIFWRG